MGKETLSDVKRFDLLVYEDLKGLAVVQVRKISGRLIWAAHTHNKSQFSLQFSSVTGIGYNGTSGFVRKPDSPEEMEELNRIGELKVVVDSITEKLPKLSMENLGKIEAFIQECGTY